MNATHATQFIHPDQNGRFAKLAPRVFGIGAIVGITALALGFLYGSLAGEATYGDDRFRHVMLAYLTAFCFYLSISMGALFYVGVQHLVRAGASVTIRRIAEIMAMNLVLLAVLAIPLLIFAPTIYHHWAHPAAHGYDPLLEGKGPWLDVSFWRLRVFAYFAVAIVIARYLWSNSVKQDRTGDRRITLNLQGISGLLVAVVALTMTFTAFDLIMSLDPHWFSTMFGVYFFAGGFLGFFVTTVLVCRFLQANGVLVGVVTTEHYHDLGKWMLAFTFFWGYIVYSQYMLIWYGAIPEETQWFARRGATTNEPEYGGMNGWSALSVVLLVCHLFVPFGALLSRWTKRGTLWLTIIAGWLFVFHYVDLYWQIMPELSNSHVMTDAGVERVWDPYAPAIVCELLMWIGMSGLWFAGLAVIARSHALAPTGDPRYAESLAFENW